MQRTFLYVQTSNAKIFGKEIVKLVLDWLRGCELIAEQVCVSFLEFWAGWNMMSGDHLPAEYPIRHRWVPASNVMADHFHSTLANTVNFHFFLAG